MNIYFALRVRPDEFGGQEQILHRRLFFIADDKLLSKREGQPLRLCGGQHSNRKRKRDKALSQSAAKLHANVTTLWMD